MDPYLIIFNVGFFPPQVINVVGSPQSHTHRHAHQRHYKKTRRLRSMQQVCTTQVGPIVFFLFLRNYETNVLLDLKRKQHMMKHISSNQQRKKKRKKIFFTLSSQC